MSYWRSEKYLRAVAGLSCVLCHRSGYCQAAHANSLAFGKGRSIKAPDWATFPACATSYREEGCHVAFDLHKDKLDKVTRMDVEAVYILRTMGRLLGNGQLRVNERVKDPVEAVKTIAALIEAGLLKLH